VDRSPARAIWKVAGIVALGLGWDLRLRLTRTAVCVHPAALACGVPLTFRVSGSTTARDQVMCEEFERLAVAGAVTFP
jgi:hypothetical protein